MSALRDSDFTRCRSCGAKVVFVLTGNGKRMPLDASPRTDGGFFVFAPEDPAQALQALSVTSPDAAAAEARAGGRPRFVSHFATCPHAATHRKPKPARARP